MKLAHSRKLLQDGDALQTVLSPSLNYPPDPLLQPMNTSTSSAAAVAKSPFKSTTHFDSSMALTILALLTAIFFMGFFSLYIRRLAEEHREAAAADDARRRRQERAEAPPPAYSSRSHPPKGLDASAVGSLPLIAYGADAKQRDCAICLSEFEERETVKLIPHCGHVFHPRCIDTWLTSHGSCPLCRSTRMGGVGEVHLGVVLAGVDLGVSSSGRNSTVDEIDTWREMETPSIGDRVPL